MHRVLDWNKYLETAEKVASEGIVMLKNKNNVLPLKKSETVSVFGRMQLHYYKSGTGSGGRVNVSHVTGITEGLENAGVKLNAELLEIYKNWDNKNPYVYGDAMRDEPWSQDEMPLDDLTVKKASENSETAIVIIARTAGEDMDAEEKQGSYLLTDTEKDMLKKVRDNFRKVVVLLNVGGIIDMNFIEECNPDSVLYIWQGGMVGGKGVADILTGKTSPSGKLPDTIAKNLSDYPAYKNFGDKNKNFYKEDIFTGYRWFETFAPEKILYPFGFGLSYTDFDVKFVSAQVTNGDFSITVEVENTGKFHGKEVVQLYTEAPQGKLKKAKRVLCGFAKTRELAPHELQRLDINFQMWWLASYDDTGVTGYRFSNVIEAGDYNFYLGTDSHSAVHVYTHHMPYRIVAGRLQQALAPVEEFERVVPVSDSESGETCISYEKVPLNEIRDGTRRLENIPAEIPSTGDRGIKLQNVLKGEKTIEEFVGQLSDYDLACLVRGEGMGSPKVTSGTASAFGGVTDSLVKFGIPAVCCCDGPSGMRFDCGAKAFSLPNGTMIASTFNMELVSELFGFVGLEMIYNKVDCLLGPGVNIHRFPLNGRNFEYFSEDPFVSGMMTVAVLRGLHSVGVTGVIKHFCANNQEWNRHFAESVISERALREIYLKPFEIAVRDGGADAVMTSYNPVNGLWGAGNYDLNMTVLRKEWGFSGIVMTDWWANINRFGKNPDKTDFSAMVKSGNNLYMVCADGSKNDDNILSALESGDLKRSELQRNAIEICSFVMKTNAMKRLTGEPDTVEIINRPQEDFSSGETSEFYELGKKFVLNLSELDTEKISVIGFTLLSSNQHWYRVTLNFEDIKNSPEIIPFTLSIMGAKVGGFVRDDGNPNSYSCEIPILSHFTAIKTEFIKTDSGFAKPVSISFEDTDREFDISDFGKRE